MLLYLLALSTGAKIVKGRWGSNVDLIVGGNKI